MRPFIAFIRGRAEAGFSVSFPDLPDCQPSGKTIAEALVNAEAALAAYCREQHAADMPIPPPSLFHELLFDERDALLALIPAPAGLGEPCGFIRPE
jgi:predicted RNase H-like HicB family nuclease